MTIKFLDYPSVNTASSDKTLYGDIITHCKDWKHFADASSEYTTAHECTHGINNDLRLQSGDWDKKNGFYVGKNRAIILDEPAIKKNQIVDFIPQELRSARYSLYVTGQSSWDDKPLYIYDEGVAYINGAWAAIELKEQENYVEAFHADYAHYRNVSIPIGRHLGQNFMLAYPFPIMRKDTAGNTIVDGHVEFITYMTAVLMAADRTQEMVTSATGVVIVGDWPKKGTGLNSRLADFSGWLFRHACNAYYRCLKNFAPFDVQDRLWATLKTGACFASQRDFLKDKVGFVFPDGEVPEDDPSPDPWYM
jgi:hypothetical protein